MRSSRTILNQNSWIWVNIGQGRNDFLCAALIVLRKTIGVT